jgi:hypothetical protein
MNGPRGPEEARTSWIGIFCRNFREYEMSARISGSKKYGTSGFSKILSEGYPNFVPSTS